MTARTNLVERIRRGGSLPAVIAVGGVEWDVGEDSQRRMLVAVTSLDPADKIKWIDARNKVRTVEVRQLRAVLAAHYQAMESRRIHARRLKDRIEGATTVEDVLAVDVHSGWPE